MKGKIQYLYALIFAFCCACNTYSTAYAKNAGNAAQALSQGCGIARKGTGNFALMKLHVLNIERTYHLRIPVTYDSNRAYPLVFRWHGAGGNGLNGGLDIELHSKDDAIVVSADGLNKSWNAKVDTDELLLNPEHSRLLFNTDPADLLFFDLMLDTISKQYCIDRNRIFSYGFSAGGYFSNLLACERGDILRASASIAGGPRGGNCKGKVASWFLHDADDEVAPIAKGKAARNRVLAANGCSSKNIDEGGGCIRYLGCDAAPVVWCESSGRGHDIRSDYAPSRVWKFFQSLR